jgi:RimJ/RimL family protein N-acetyltransferase
MVECILRPFRLADVESSSDSGASEQGVPFSWYGFRSTQELASKWAADGFLGSEKGQLVVAIPGTEEVAGRVSWTRKHWGPPDTSWCWEIGISLKSAFRQRGIGTNAQIQLCAYLFAHTRAMRIQAATDVGNLAEQRSLEKAGFQREGVLRSAQFRDGGWHDMALYATIRPHSDS